MKRRLFLLLTMAGLIALLCGCNMRTVEQMYRLPSRSEADGSLQRAIDAAMSGLEYCAPLTGENQQAVQMADLDGDGDEEFLIYAKGGSENPLRILIFRNQEETFSHMETIESNGSAFDRVEYVQMDGNPGLELVVGRQLDAQVMGAVSVYTMFGDDAHQLLSANYSKFLTVDMDADSMTELFVLQPGPTDTDCGVATLYGMENGSMERSIEVGMSEPVSRLKRIIIGNLHGGYTAVYVASTAGETALITDVYALVDGVLTNVSSANDSGTSVQTMRNYYVYADDIDNDGVVELPQLMSMRTLDGGRTSADRYDLIRWYAMTANGAEVDKQFTYHNFVDGWYFSLEDRWARRLMVQRSGNIYDFYIWEDGYETPRQVMSIYALTGQSRETEATQDDRFMLYKTDTVVYAAKLGEFAADYGFTQEYIIRSFQLIKLDWKTGET